MTQPLVVCSWKEYSCKNPAKTGGFCGLHVERGVLLNAAKEKGVRVCDDGKRGCRNETLNNKSKCEECLLKVRQKENSLYNERKAKGDVCTMCGIKLETLTTGIKDNLVQKCEKCYASIRKTEDKRGVRGRNYAFEKKINPAMHYREYADSAARRNIQFDITLEEFMEIVNKPCTYCNTFQESEALGIDRVDSFQGYVKGNIVPCCGCCNTMKQQLSLNEFAEHITRIYRVFASKILDNQPTSNTIQSTKPSYEMKPKQIVSLYSKKQLQTYIDMCIADDRNLTYIDKMKDVLTYTMTNTDFRNYLENASRTDVRSQQLTLSKQRNRVPRKELIALLNSSRPDDVVNLYESVFGTTKDIKHDMRTLSLQWNTLGETEKTKKLEEYLTKYNNARAYSKKISEEPTSQAELITPISTTYISQSIEYKVPESSITQPTQWKASNIYKYIKEGKASVYLEYLQENNPSVEGMEERLNTLVTQITSLTPEDSESAIKKFIEELRTVRHNKLCYDKNTSILDREDRQIWKNDTVLRAFAMKSLDGFKAFTEEGTGDKPDDPIWIKRWDAFVSSVYAEKADERKKKLISHFLTAQRTKRYRRKQPPDSSSLSKVDA